jgi:hypothetical protein
MAHYFNQTKYKSFLRQLHIYGFKRISKGMDRGAYFHGFFLQNNKSLTLHMVRKKIKGAGKTKSRHSQHQIEDPNFYKDMVITEDHHPTPCYNETTRDFPNMAKPAPSIADVFGVTAKTTYISIAGATGSLDSWLDRMMKGEEQQKIASSLLEDTYSFCKKDPSCPGNVAASFSKEHLEDGDEVFFEGKRFHFVEASSVPTIPGVEDFMASVTAKGAVVYMPRCA